MDEIINMMEKRTEDSDLEGLLILNALFEAARAGEAGKDLALIADELKGLIARKKSEAP